MSVRQAMEFSTPRLPAAIPGQTSHAAPVRPLKLLNWLCWNSCRPTMSVPLPVSALNAQPMRTPLEA